MTSITWPSGLERPVIPTSHRKRPLPHTIQPRDPDVLGRHAQEQVRPSHVAAWCLGGTVGWAALIGSGWLAVDVLGHLIA